MCVCGVHESVHVFVRVSVFVCKCVRVCVLAYLFGRVCVCVWACLGQGTSWCVGRGGTQY